MTTKQIAIQAIQQLPDDASWEEIQERIRFIAGVRAALHARQLALAQGQPGRRGLRVEGFGPAQRDRRYRPKLFDAESGNRGNFTPSYADAHRRAGATELPTR